MTRSAAKAAATCSSAALALTTFSAARARTSFTTAHPIGRCACNQFHSSLKQPWRQIIEILPPVDPGVPAAGELEFVIDVGFGQDRVEVFGRVQGEILVADA